MAGRPKGFDPDVVLEKAMDLFWIQGYHNAGLKSLLNHMGIGRQSLYDTYGNKHALFIESLQLYDRIVFGRLREVLDTPGSPLANIDNLLGMWKWLATRDDARGCLATNTAVEVCRADPEVAQIIRGNFQKLENAIQATLDRAVEAEELSPTTDTRALARFLVNTGHGLIAMGKMGTSPDGLDDVIRITRLTLQNVT